MAMSTIAPSLELWKGLEYRDMFNSFWIKIFDENLPFEDDMF